MDLFQTLLIKLIPLYILMGLGFIAGRYLRVDSHSVARLMMYIIVPFVFFTGISRMEMSPALALVPLVGYAIASIMGLGGYAIAKRFYGDTRANIVGLASGTANIGYFGLPIAMMLFDAQGVGIYLLGIIGNVLYENSFGFYLTARGEHDAREALRRTVRMPAIHAAILGIIASALDWQPWPVILDTASYFTGTYTVLGMMMIGLGLAGLEHFRVDMRFTGLLFLIKFVGWPLLAGGFVMLDTGLLHWFDRPVHHALMLVSFMPLSANSVAIASLLNCQPQRTATAVLLSTFVALIYVPVMVGLFLR
jgi:predicted permease